MVIYEYEMAIPYIDNHIELAISIDILECQGHRCQILPITDQGRANEYPGFCAITARKFYDLYVTVQVQGNEMARVGERVIMAYYNICLKRTRTAIMPVVLGGLPPTSSGSEDDPSNEHDEHRYANKHKTVRAKSIADQLVSAKVTVVNA